MLTHIASKIDESNQIVYDDAAIARLLNRDQVQLVQPTEPTVTEGEGINEYLSSFKVAFYQVKEADEEEEDGVDIDLEEESKVNLFFSLDH